jgi:hypothetical protein
MFKSCHGAAAEDLTVLSLYVMQNILQPVLAAAAQPGRPGRLHSYVWMMLHSTVAEVSSAALRLFWDWHVLSDDHSIP